MTRLKNPWWRLLRPMHSAMTFAAVVLAQVVATKSVNISFLFAAVGPAVVTAAAFPINDLSDVEADKRNRREDRPLVKGEITREEALVASVLLYGAGILLSTFSTIAFGFVLAYAVLSAWYSLGMKKLFLLPNVFVATTYSAPFAYGALVSTGEIGTPIAAFCLMAFSAGLARELVNGLRDEVGDRKAGVRSVAIVMGEEKTKTMAALFFAMAIAFSPLPFLATNSLAYAIVVLIADALFAWAVLALLEKKYAEAHRIAFLAMGAGILAFAGLLV